MHKYTKKFIERYTETLDDYPSSIALLSELGLYIFKDRLSKETVQNRIFKFCPNIVHDGGNSQRDNVLYVRTVGMLDDLGLLPAIYDYATDIADFYADNATSSPVQAMEIVISAIFAQVRELANIERQEWIERTAAARELAVAVRKIMIDRFKEAVFFGERRETTVWEELKIQL